MADKKTAAKPAAKKAAPATAVKPVKKVDVVEEAKKELKQMESNKTTSSTPKKSSGFSWTTFVGAVLLTCAALLLGNVIKSTIEKNNIEAFLPELVAALGGGMVVENIGPLTEKSGLYEFTIKFADTPDEFTSGITKDGQLFFVDMSLEVEQLMAEIESGAMATPAPSVTCETITKSDSPMLDVYVSSDCSYCPQIEQEMAAAIEQAPELANHFNLRYVGGLDENGEPISLFGDPAGGEENMRQVCIRDTDPTNFWSYIDCKAVEGSDAATCMAEAGVNTAAIDTCMTDGTGVAAIAADQVLADGNAVQGTPSLFVNGSEPVSEFDFGGRVSDAFKEIVCCGSTTEAGFCSQTLESPSGGV